MSQDQPRGVHLTDKQVVFSVIVATAAVVVAFLFGVFVGRGVRSLRPPAADAGMTSASVVPDAGTLPTDAEGASPVESAGAVTPPPESLTYPQRLSTADPPVETLKLPPADPAPPVPPPDVPGETPDNGGAGAVKPEAAPAPSAGGFTVQVAAVRRRGEAQAIVDRLVKKGFAAYVFVPPGGDRAGGFRVRVGSFKSRQEAEALAARLQKEEQYKPWITR